MSNKLDKAEHDIRGLLDDGNTKAALRVAQQTVKKNKSPHALSLHALTLDACGKRKESLALVQKIVDAPALDIKSLTLLRFLLARMNKPELIVECFEKAYKSEKDPNVKERLRQDLFAAYVQQHDFKKVQMFAMEMSKANPNEKAFKRWQTIGVLLQVPNPQCGGAEPNEAQQKVLKLATAMLARDVNAPDFDSFELLQLYVDVLDSQGRYDELVTLLRSAATKRLLREAVPRERRRRLVSALLGAAHWRDALCESRLLLADDDDDWFAWTSALDAALHIDGDTPASTCLTQPAPAPAAAAAAAAATTTTAAVAPEAPREPKPAACASSCCGHHDDHEPTHQPARPDPRCDGCTVDESDVAAVLQLLARAQQSIDEAASAAASPRAPHLFRLEVRRRIDTDPQIKSQLKSIDEKTLPSLSALASHYVDLFGHKPCCPPDLEPFLETLKLNVNVNEWLTTLLEKIPNEPPTVEKVASDDVAQRKACVGWIERWTTVGLLSEQLGIDATLDAAALRTAAEQDVARYAATRSWALAYEHRESPQAGDALTALAARRLLRAARLAARDDDAQRAAFTDKMRATALLLAALKLSPHNFELKLQLCVCFDALSAYEPVPEIRKQLEIQHVQVDSMSHVFLEPSIANVAFKSATSICEEILAYHRSSGSDVPHWFAEAFHRQSYSRIIDLQRFEYRLTHSHQLAVAAVEHAHLDIIDAQLQLTKIRSILSDLPSQAKIISDEAAKKLVFNQDEKALANILAPRSYDASNSSATHQVDKPTRLLWLRLRSNLLQLLSQLLLASNDNNTSNSNKKSKNAKTSSAVSSIDIDEIQSTLSTVRQLLTQLNGGEEVQESGTHALQQYTLLVQSLALLIDVRSAFVNDSDAAECTSLGDSLRQTGAKFEQLVTALVQLVDTNSVDASQHIPTLCVAATLTLRWPLIVVAIANSSAPSQKKASAHSKALKEELRHLQTAITQSAQTLAARIDTLASTLEPSSPPTTNFLRTNDPLLTVLFDSTSEVEKHVNETEHQVNYAHQVALRELIAMLKTK